MFFNYKGTLKESEVLSFWLITLAEYKMSELHVIKIERTIRLLWALLKVKITLGHSSFTRPVVSNPITYLSKYILCVRI